MHYDGCELEATAVGDSNGGVNGCNGESMIIQLRRAFLSTRNSLPHDLHEQPAPRLLKNVETAILSQHVSFYFSSKALVVCMWMLSGVITASGQPHRALRRQQALCIERSQAQRG